MTQADLQPSEAFESLVTRDSYLAALLLYHDAVLTDVSAEDGRASYRLSAPRSLIQAVRTMWAEPTSTVNLRRYSDCLRVIYEKRGHAIRRG